MKTATTLITCDHCEEARVDLDDLSPGDIGASAASIGWRVRGHSAVCPDCISLDDLIISSVTKRITTTLDYMRRGAITGHTALTQLSKTVAQHF